jgi:hypothetical protein
LKNRSITREQADAIVLPVVHELDGRHVPATLLTNPVGHPAASASSAIVAGISPQAQLKAIDSAA